MLTDFGKAARDLRASKEVTLVEFSSKAGKAPSYFSNIEHGRKAATDTVLNDYIEALTLTNDDADRLRRAAGLSNAIRQFSTYPDGIARVVGIIQAHSGEWSSDFLANLERTLNSELERNGQLQKQSVFKFRKKGPGDFGSVDPERLVQLARSAEKVRRRYADDSQRIDIIKVLEGEEARREELELDILETLDKRKNAYAYCRFEADRTFLVADDAFYLGAASGKVFNRHALAHELAHVELHSDSAVAELRRGMKLQGVQRQVVNGPLEEREANYWATFLLTPWRVLFLNSDYIAHEQKYGVSRDEMKNLYKMMHVKSVEGWFYSLLDDGSF